MIKEIQKPEMSPLVVGEHTKVLQVNALAGMEIPLHHSTVETTIIVQEGKAILKMPDAEHVLAIGTVFIIPANAEHSLSVQLNFKAIAVMASNGTINFKN